MWRRLMNGDARGLGCVMCMIKQFIDREYDLLSDMSQNKYFVFEQVRGFLESNGIIWEHMFQLFRKSEDGYLHYSFGDLEITFTRTEEFSEQIGDCEDAIELEIDFEKNNVERKATFTYTMKDLAQANRREQARMDSWGE
jgi:site-specific DNA-cytosine methylase